MFRHLLLILLSPLPAMVCRPHRDHRDRRGPALRQPMIISQRQLGKHPRLAGSEKLALVLTRLWMKQQLKSVLVVGPDTVVGWRRQIVRGHQKATQGYFDKGIKSWYQ